MDILLQALLFFLIWCMVFFASLPFAITTQMEQRHIVPGTSESAPVHTKLKRKVVIATLVTLVLWLVTREIIQNGWIRLEDIPLPPGVELE
ncbi:MAG: DUF1467 family protein [Hyphomicrobiales bacterium]|nr:DUF1467 family protein [Hyphomicrobiales bacterium]MCY4047999.1 DUF1467 family protein [Hyphomicrobiales bacterium]